MKTKLFFTALLFFLSISASYASFPVVRATKAASFPVARTTNANDNSEVVRQNETVIAPAATLAKKELLTALLLYFFAGYVAAHRWYLGSPAGWNILYIITFCGLGIWAIIDLIDMATGNYPGL